MRRAFPFSWLSVAGIFTAVAGGLGWLLFGVAGEPAGRRLLLEMPRSDEPAEVRAERPEVALWKDEGRRSSLDDVRGLPAGEWRRPDSSEMFPLFNHEVGWMRVTMRNSTARPVSGVMTMADYFLDYAELWSDKDGGWRRERSGAALAGGERALAGRDVAFALVVPARGERTVYLRLTNRSAIMLRPEWWPDAVVFQRKQVRSALAEGVYFGGLLALLGYNLALWVRLRFADIGWYVLYLGTVLTFMVLSRALPAEVGWALGSPGVETLVAAAAAASGIFLIQFARAFLELRQNLPRGDRAVRWLGAALVVLTVGAGTIPWTNYTMWMRLVALVMVALHATLLGLACMSWRRGVKQARFFVLSFSCLFAGLAPLVAVWFNADLWVGAGIKGLMIGSALEMSLLALAVANRFAQTQRRLVEETEQRRAVEAAYADELEVEVRERTRDLNEANQDKDRMLIALGHDLRSPLAALTKRATQLRQRERSAETTEALAGFAGEAAGEGRQMLHLIEDIVLWARLRTGARPRANAIAARELVAPVVALHQALAERRGVTLTADVPVGLAIQTDLVLAQTMVRNLVANAVKFAAARVEVGVRAEADGATVVITVKDDGPGLPAVARARLLGGEFDGEGGGMGLRLVREIGVALGASLAAETPAGGGTVIGLTLPAAATAVESTTTTEQGGGS